MQPQRSLTMKHKRKCNCQIAQYCYNKSLILLKDSINIWVLARMTCHNIKYLITHFRASWNAFFKILSQGKFQDLLYGPLLVWYVIIVILQTNPEHSAQLPAWITLCMLWSLTVCYQAYIQYMRFARRAEGIKAARIVFKAAREDQRTKYQLYVAAALMEYYCSKVSSS